MSKTLQIVRLFRDMESSFGVKPQYCYMSPGAYHDVTHESMQPTGMTMTHFMGMRVVVRPDVPQDCVYLTIDSVDV